MADTTPMQNPHLDSSPFYYSGGPTGVLLVHGFTATPVEVKLVGQFLHERGYTVAGPRLPGHGTTVNDMNRCTWRDWTEHVAHAYADLLARCERVFVGGESTGGLLALYLASQRPEIAGLVAYAPALRAASRLIYLAPFLKIFVKALKKKRARGDPDSVVNRRWQGYTVDPIPAVAELLALQRQVRRRLPRIRQPLLVMQGCLDTTLDLRGAAEVVALANSSDKELIWFERSTHCLILDVEWEIAAERTWAFLKRLEGRTEIRD